MVANRDQLAFHPEIDETEVMVESRPDGFREISAVNRSFQVENHDLSNNEWLSTTKIVDLKVNPAINNSDFESSNTRSMPFYGFNLSTHFFKS
jgi:hypothetical protein